MKHYSEERKQAVIRKMLSPDPVPIAELVREEGISDATLYTWRKQAKTKGQRVSDSSNKPGVWSAEVRFASLVETASMTKTEISQYCRERGLYPDQLQQWKSEFIGSQQTGKQRNRDEQQQLKAVRKKNKQLEKELNRKNKALAETAALLVLQKKFNALLDENEDE
ncbi:hypothetical protein AB833_00190 [Chromatiales bacterium (ex Bugula neritina AB1)]|nr:hypothetical protein AB833_00190 [Chromatiales bacterium (ex Bugula neritina AB1)]